MGVLSVCMAEFFIVVDSPVVSACKQWFSLFRSRGFTGVWMGKERKNTSISLGRRRFGFFPFCLFFFFPWSMDRYTWLFWSIDRWAVSTSSVLQSK